jgi:hypothetical protein
VQLRLAGCINSSALVTAVQPMKTTKVIVL